MNNGLMGPEATIEPSRPGRAARRLASGAATVLALLAPAAPASADTQFGGDPSQAVTPGLSCQLGAPTGFVFPEVFIGTQGSPSCMWT